MGARENDAPGVEYTRVGYFLSGDEAIGRLSRPRVASSDVVRTELDPHLLLATAAVTPLFTL